MFFVYVFKESLYQNDEWSIFVRNFQKNIIPKVNKIKVKITIRRMDKFDFINKYTYGSRNIVTKLIVTIIVLTNTFDVIWGLNENVL